MMQSGWVLCNTNIQGFGRQSARAYVHAPQRPTDLTDAISTRTRHTTRIHVLQSSIITVYNESFTAGVVPPSLANNGEQCVCTSVHVWILTGLARAHRAQHTSRLNSHKNTHTRTRWSTRTVGEFTTPPPAKPRRKHKRKQTGWRDCGNCVCWIGRARARHPGRAQFNADLPL